MPDRASGLRDRQLPLLVVEDSEIDTKLLLRQFSARKRRPAGFPREYELGNGGSKYRRCPRFKIVDVRKWLNSRALW